MKRGLLRSKQGLSGVITLVLLVALVVVAVAIVGVVLKNIISEEVEGTESCFGNYNKVTLNSLYTCYNSSATSLHFSLSIGDINVDEVLVAISGIGTTKSFSISNTASPISGVTNYPAGGSVNIQLPEKNGGLTYVHDLTGFSGKPDRIEIAPVLNGKQCDVSDSLSSIDNC